MAIKKPSLALNMDDPEDKKLYEYVTFLPNGKGKRNTSKFLRTLVDRAYQEEKAKEKAVTNSVIRSSNGGFKFTLE